MIRAIIVDDSRLEIESLMESVDWKLAGIDICGTALNGKKGLELFQKEHPDLIIADIQMPVMDGIEMCSSIREQDPDVMIVFLTSYRDFDYAKAGYSLGVKEYILKQDIDRNETTALFQRLQGDIMKQNRELAKGECGKLSDAYSSGVSMAIQYMRVHISDKQLDMTKLAREVSLSPSRFRAVFKEETGYSPSVFLSELRLRKAKRLLAETCMKMDEIADEIGFLDGKYFRKVFQAKYRVTPREFRENGGSVPSGEEDLTVKQRKMKKQDDE